MPIDEFKIRDLERRVRELEEMLKGLQPERRRDELGSTNVPLKYICLIDPFSGRVSKISNDGGTALRFQTVR